MSGIYLRYVFPFILVIAMCGGSWFMGYSHARNVYHRAAEEQARKAQEDTNNAQRKADEIAEELKYEKSRADNLVTKRVFYVKAACPVSTTPGDSKGSNGETYAQLDTETARRIIAITTDGDKAIMQLTACQDILEVIRKEYLK